MRGCARGPWGLAVALAGAVAIVPASGAAGPFDIVRVDEFIGAARGLLGRTTADVERRLGPPRTVTPGAVPTYRDRRVFRVTRRLSYDGVTVEVLDTGRVRRVHLERAGLGLPLGLDVGAAREDVLRVLGEPTQADAGQLLYLYSDGFPDTVRFELRDGRVRAIQWDYGSAEGDPAGP
ncbi:MAG TPA: hypothetical protein VFC42_13345 [Methylomirabilota bacterium]|nr:hypothetical protein [Methylomirabilota bacterium]